MFGFFGSKGSKKNPVKEDKELTNVELQKITLKVTELEKHVEILTGNDKINSLNQLGKLNKELNKYDDAIKYFEESIAEKEQFGDAYNGLLDLYEIKRKEAAYKKNDADIEKWVSKIDGLMNISKKILKSNY